MLVPAFAVDRTELVLLELHRLLGAGRIPRRAGLRRQPDGAGGPRGLPPGSARRRASRVRATPRGRLRPLPEVHAVARRRTSRSELNRPAHPCIIVSASGMATGGRVVHHLAHQLPDPRNTVVLTGYQADGHPRRAAARRCPSGEDVRPLRAGPRRDRARSTTSRSTPTPTSCSRGCGARRTPPRTIYVVHGEPDARPTAGATDPRRARLVRGRAAVRRAGPSRLNLSHPIAVFGPCRGPSPTGTLSTWTRGHRASSWGTTDHRTPIPQLPGQRGQLFSEARR